AVEHTKLSSSDDIETWRPYWKELLSELEFRCWCCGVPDLVSLPTPVRNFVDFTILVVGNPLADRFAVPEMPGAFNSAVYAVPLPITNRLAVFHFALGRASCRESVYISAVGVAVSK